MAPAKKQEDQGYFLISVQGTEGDNLPLEELTKFLYEFNLLYDMSRLIVDPQYETYKITQATSSRVVNRLRADDKLYVEKLSLNSPLDLNLLLNASGVALNAIGVVLNAIGLKRSSQGQGSSEISFSRKEAGSRKPDGPETVFADSGLELKLPPPNEDFLETLQIRKATKHYDREQSRLIGSPVHVEEVTITYTRETRRRSR